MTTSSPSGRVVTSTLAALVTVAVAVLAQVVTHGSDTAMLPAAHHEVVAGPR